MVVVYLMLCNGMGWDRLSRVEFKYLQKTFDNNVWPYGADTGHITAGINSQYTHMVCATKSLLHILVCTSVFVHAAC